MPHSTAITLFISEIVQKSLTRIQAPACVLLADAVRLATRFREFHVIECILNCHLAVRLHREREAIPMLAVDNLPLPPNDQAPLDSFQGNIRRAVIRVKREKGGGLPLTPAACCDPPLWPPVTVLDFGVLYQCVEVVGRGVLEAFSGFGRWLRQRRQHAASLLEYLIVNSYKIENVSYNLR